MDPFFGKKLSGLQINDLINLSDQSIAENLYLDYKTELSLWDSNKQRQDHKRITFLRDVTSFANSEGGLILYGVTEKKVDTDSTGLPEDFPGCQIKSGDELVKLIDNLVRTGIDERLPTPLEIGIIPVGDQSVVAIRVTPSYRSPHKVILGRSNDFYIRVNAGNEPMSTAQIRDAVLRSEQFETQSIEWVEDRLKYLRTELGFARRRPYFAFYYVPMRRDSNSVQVGDSEIAKRLNRINVHSLEDNLHATGQYCFEGYRLSWREVSTERVTVFREGAVEFYSEYSVRIADDQYFTHWIFEKALQSAINELKSLSFDQIISTPAMSLLILGNVGGARILKTSHSHYRQMLEDHNQDFARHEIEREQLGPIPIQIADVSILQDDRLLQSFLDILWQSANYRCCEGFDDNGKYVGYQQ